MNPKEALQHFLGCALELRGCTKETSEAIEILRTTLRRDWAVRVLDAWAAHNRERVPSPYQPLNTERLWRVTVALSYDRRSGRHFDGATPDTARLAAALAVFPDLYRNAPGWPGECP